MKAGDRIRLHVPVMAGWGFKKLEDFTVEEFRFCLGIFKSEEHRLAGRFTPLCELYEPGPESESKYIENFGEYRTNMVQEFMNLPKYA
jgi:hypothetical protein